LEEESLAKDRQIETLKKEKEEIIKKLKDLGVEEDLMNLKGLTPGMVVTLGEQNL
jgi:N utilization substance protein A